MATSVVRLPDKEFVPQSNQPLRVIGCVPSAFLSFKASRTSVAFIPFSSMAIFTYKARNKKGAVTNGQVEATDRRIAMQRMQAMGLSPITVKEQVTNSVFSKFRDKGRLLKKQTSSAETVEEGSGESSNKGSKREGVGLIVLNRLMELHSSGLPVGDSIRILSQRTSNKEQRNLAKSIWRDLSEGATLAGAMARHPKYFPKSISYVIEAGEATGNLAPILRKVIDYLEEKKAIRKKMIASMIYPGVVCTVAVGVVILFLTVLLPKIQGMMDRLGGEMTWTARILIDGSAFLAKFGPIGIVLAVVGLFFFFQWRRTEKGLRQTDSVLLKLPFLGKIFLYSDLFQVGNLITTLLQSGINTTETLSLTEKTVKNTELKERFRVSRLQVNEGLSIAQAFQRNQFLPDLAIDILAVGENTGNIAHSMNEVTKGFRDQLSTRLSQLTAIVSTTALLIAFLLVALIAIGIVTSILQVSQSLS